jgi:hypothetical protein
MSNRTIIFVLLMVFFQISVFGKSQCTKSHIKSLVGMGFSVQEALKMCQNGKTNQNTKLISKGMFEGIYAVLSVSDEIIDLIEVTSKGQFYGLEEGFRRKGKVVGEISINTENSTITRKRGGRLNKVRPVKNVKIEEAFITKFEMLDNNNIIDAIIYRISDAGITSEKRTELANALKRDGISFVRGEEKISENNTKPIAFFQAIGKNCDKALNLTEVLGKKDEKKSRPDEAYKDVYIGYFQYGDLFCAKSSDTFIISSISINRNYPGKLPFGLKFSDSKEQIVRLLGKPTKDGYSIEYNNLGISILHWNDGSEKQFESISFKAFPKEAQKRLQP